MICSNCKTLNSDSSKFCIKCGSQLVNKQVVNNPSDPQNINYNTSQLQGNIAINPNQPISPSMPSYVNNMKNNNNINNYKNNNINVPVLSLKNFVLLIISFILKPFSTFKERSNIFNNLKSSITLTTIISVITTVINLIMTMISSIFVKTLDIKTFKYKTTIVWENLKEIEYFKIIFQQLLTVIIIIFAIAIIYYLASLIVKKNANFSKFLGIAAISVVPLLICNLLLEPLAVLIFPKISTAISIIGLVYTIIILYENINSEVLLDGNMKYYFNLICLSILAITGYYLLINTVTSSVEDSVSDILNNFGF